MVEGTTENGPPAMVETDKRHRRDISDLGASDLLSGRDRVASSEGTHTVMVDPAEHIESVGESTTENLEITSPTGNVQIKDVKNIFRESTRCSEVDQEQIDRVKMSTYSSRHMKEEPKLFAFLSRSLI